MDELKRLMEQPPVVVGGTAGSVTHLAAEILLERGCYIGSNLNNTLDNKDFESCLGNRYTWIKSNYPFKNTDDSARSDVHLFKKMYFGEKLSLGEKARSSALKMEVLKPQNTAFKKARTQMQKTETSEGLVVKSKRTIEKSKSGFRGWGFKSTESPFLLNLLIDVFPDMKFVHFIRDGRDIAFAENSKVLSFYADILGLEFDGTPKASYEVWARMNDMIMDLCEERLPEDNYHVLSLEDLCEEPRTEIGTLLRFVGLHVPQGSYQLYYTPKLPETSGAWEERALEIADIDPKTLDDIGYIDSEEWAADCKRRAGEAESAAAAQPSEEEGESEG